MTLCKQSVKFTDEIKNIVACIAQLCKKARVECECDFFTDGVVQRVLARGSTETAASRTHKMLSSGI